MKNTKCLFDESKMTPEGMVSVSQLQTFLSCKKKWTYGYIENLTPRVDRPFLTIGKLCHKGMQVAMEHYWEHGKDQFYEREQSLNTAILAMVSEHTEYLRNNCFLQEEIPDIERILTDAEAVFTQAFWEFDIERWEVVTLQKNGKPIPALELHFRVPCPPAKGLHGYIDAILKDKETGFIWCTDYKFRKSLSPDEDEAYNIQNAVYSYACKRMGVEITGTMTWQHINTPAADPAILKDGKISRAKIKTTWAHYEQFCREHGQDPQGYFLEMEEKLRDIEWYRTTLEYRNDETIENIWKECVLPVARTIKAAHRQNAVNFRSLYPWNCKMCQYQSLCQAELRNHDADFVRQNEYILRSSRQTEEIPEQT